MALVEYEIDGNIAIVSLNRPSAANAQNLELLTEFNERMLEAARDDSVRVIVVRANGDHFSAGHDLKDPWGGWPQRGDGIENWYGFEGEIFLRWTRAWRDIPKPTIAAVQGACVAGGLMLAWPCDLIIASDDALFGDTVGRLGVGAGVEYHGHTWEFGPRKAKELLFTSRYITAAQAEQIGMVNRVVSRNDLDQETMTLAREIAEVDPFSLQMTKRAINLVQDIQGFYTSLQAVFDQHWLGHANVFARRGFPDEEKDSGRLITADDMIAAGRETKPPADEGPTEA
jgi:enoyl-CoA hydratase